MNTKTIIRSRSVRASIPTFEDSDYAAFFRYAVEAVKAYEAGRMTAADAAKRIFDMTDNYAFAVPTAKTPWFARGGLRKKISLRNET